MIRQGRRPGCNGGEIDQQPGYAGLLDLLDHLLDQRHALIQLLAFAETKDGDVLDHLVRRITHRESAGARGSRGMDTSTGVALQK